MFQKRVIISVTVLAVVIIGSFAVRYVLGQEIGVEKPFDMHQQRIFNFSFSEDGDAVTLGYLKSALTTIDVGVAECADCDSRFVNQWEAWNTNLTLHGGLYTPATQPWSGNPGAGYGKIQYHANRWYIVADSGSDRIVQFRRDGSNTSYIANDGKFIGPADTLDGIDSPSFLRSDANDTYTGILTVNGDLQRGGHSKGYFVGSYNNIGANSAQSNPIYVIGSSYKPTDTALGNMYGIGYAHGNFWGTGGGKPNGWGQYVAADGDIRVVLDGSNGIVWSSGSVRSPIFYDSNNTAYYVDPASTSKFNKINLGGVERTTWPTGGDNLGNHTATQNLNMAGYQIQNMRLENRTSDPASPAVGQIWLRTDL